ncbi:MAG: nucleoside recognition domain-containing protein [bacterium]
MEIKHIFELLSVWILPLMLLIVLLFAFFKKVPLYETFIDGAKEGFDVGVKIIPYLVAIMVAIGMFRASGAIDIISFYLADALKTVHFPVETLPLAIIRPLSGSGALGILSEIAQKHSGNDPVALTAAVMMGSSETTFYVLTVYFGAVGIKKFRHALPVGIIADLIGLSVALWVSHLIF